MGKGSKDKGRLVFKDNAEPSSNKGVITPDVRGQVRQQRTTAGDGYPPGVPECDVVLKGSKRFWYLEPALFIFGIGGFIVSAMLLVRYYWNNSIVD